MRLYCVAHVHNSEASVVAALIGLDHILDREEYNYIDHIIYASALRSIMVCRSLSLSHCLHLHRLDLAFFYIGS
jgi:hypothetical protein